jgi:hypothetical protein
MAASPTGDINRVAKAQPRGHRSVATPPHRRRRRGCTPLRALDRPDSGGVRGAAALDRSGPVCFPSTEACPLRCRTCRNVSPSLWLQNGRNAIRSGDRRRRASAIRRRSTSPLLWREATPCGRPGAPLPRWRKRPQRQCRSHAGEPDHAMPARTNPEAAAAPCGRGYRARAQCSLRPRHLSEASLRGRVTARAIPQREDGPWASLRRRAVQHQAASAPSMRMAARSLGRRIEKPEAFIAEDHAA